MIAIEQNLRRHPPGSINELRVDLGYGRYERVIARPGSFSATYGQYAIVMCEAGVTGTVTLNGSKSISGRLGVQVYSVLRPNDHVAGILDEAVTYEILLLDPAFVDELVNKEAGGMCAVMPVAIRVEAPPLVKSIWGRLRISVDGEEPTAEASTRLCIELLVARLIESQVGMPDPADAQQNLDAVKRAVAYIESHLAEPLDVGSIANAAGLSPFYFSRVFKAAYRTSVHRYVLERRLDRARELLADTDIAISAIALETGFSSQSHLTTTFRHRFGLPPAQYRANGGWTAQSLRADPTMDRS